MSQTHNEPTLTFEDLRDEAFLFEKRKYLIQAKEKEYMDGSVVALDFPDVHGNPFFATYGDNSGDDEYHLKTLFVNNEKNIKALRFVDECLEKQGFFKRCDLDKIWVVLVPTGETEGFVYNFPEDKTAVEGFAHAVRRRLLGEDSMEQE